MMAYELLLPSNVHVPALFCLLKHNDPFNVRPSPVTYVSVVFALFTSHISQGPRAPLPSRRSHLDSSGSDSDDVQTSRRDVHVHYF